MTLGRWNLTRQDGLLLLLGLASSFAQPPCRIARNPLLCWQPGPTAFYQRGGARTTSAQHSLQRQGAAGGQRRREPIVVLATRGEQA